MGKKLKLFVIKKSGQRIRVDRQSKVADLILKKDLNDLQDRWFKKNAGVVQSAKKKNRPIRPGDMEPVFHQVGYHDWDGIVKALGIQKDVDQKNRQFDLHIDYVNIRGLVRMVRVVSGLKP